MTNFEKGLKMSSLFRETMKEIFLVKTISNSTHIVQKDCE